MTENIIMMIVWLIVFLIALLIEIFTEALLTVWFCVGAVVALLVTFIPGMPYWGELIVFVVASLISFLILKPLVSKNLKRIHSRTNIDTIIGRKGVLMKPISSLESGEVKIDGVIWTAIKRDSDEEMKTGDVVEVISVLGNKLLVKKISI